MNNQVLKRIKSVLSAAYGDRLRGVVLFGSSAKGNDTFESDIDLFVLFADDVSLAADLRGVIKALYPIQLELLRPIHPIPVNEGLFHSGKFAIFRRAQAEGIPL